MWWKVGFLVLTLTVYELKAACEEGDRICDPATEGTVNEICIPESWWCDNWIGGPDCPNGEDEQVCDASVCEAMERKYCAADDKCINQDYWCDGYQYDCSDNEDEANCDEVACEALGKFYCDDRCIPAEYRCDGFADCLDYKDEADCAASDCHQGTTHCPTDMVCLYSYYVDDCDGYSDCPSGDDEQNCQTCNDGAFKCPNEDKCIRASWVCDSVPDCEKGEDDYGCNECAANEFLCSNGNCIFGDSVCDASKTDDCGDNSDQKGPGCPDCASDQRICDPATVGTPEKVCISDDLWCDGYNDCPNNEDEASCTECNGGAFKCPNEDKCIKDLWTCDSYPDCQKGEDDYGCDTCNATEFVCANDACVSGDDVCDGNDDCADGSDENGDVCQQGSPAKKMLRRTRERKHSDKRGLVQNKRTSTLDAEMLRQRKSKSTSERRVQALKKALGERLAANRKAHTSSNKQRSQSTSDRRNNIKEKAKNSDTNVQRLKTLKALRERLIEIQKFEGQKDVSSRNNKKENRGRHEGMDRRNKERVRVAQDYTNKSRLERLLRARYLKKTKGNK